MTVQNWAIRGVRIAITLLLFGYVIHRTGLLTAAGWHRFTAALAGADIGVLALALAMSLVLDLVSAAKWRVLARSLGLRGGLLRLFAFYLAGRFFNLVLPSNIGGDVVRIRMQGEVSGRLALSAASVFMERLTGFVTLLVLALGVAALSVTALAIPYIAPAIAGSAAGVAMLVWMIVDRRPFERLRTIATRILPRSAPLFAKADRMHDAVRLYRHHPRALGMAMLLSLLFHAACGISFWLYLRVFDATVPLVPVLIATPLMMVIMNIPLSIGNIGVLEFSYMVTLGAFGVPPAVALSAALLDRGRSIIAAGVGAVVYNVIKARSPTPLVA